MNENQFENPSNAEVERGLVSRRTVVKTVAWGVPAIALAVAAPAASASGWNVVPSSISIVTPITLPTWPTAVNVFSQTPSKSSNAVTMTLPSTTGIAVGDSVYMSGVSGTGYNVAGTGTPFPVTAVTASTVTFTAAGATGAVTTKTTRISAVSRGSGANTGVLTVTVSPALSAAFTAGEWVTIGGLTTAAWNGTYKVMGLVAGASAAPTTTVFSVTNVSNPTAAPALATNNAAVPTGAVTAASGKVTLTTAANTFTVGQLVNVSGVVPATYNGTYLITDRTSTSISYMNATTGNITTAGTASANFVNNGTMIPNTPTMFSWIGGSPYSPSSVSFVDNVGPYPWTVTAQTVTYSFDRSLTANAFSPIYAMPSFELYGLADADSTAAIAASETATANSVVLSQGVEVLADDGRYWSSSDPDVNGSVISIVLTALTSYEVTGANSTIYLPRVGIKATGMAVANAHVKPLKYTLSWSAPSNSMTQLTGSNF
ncbi:MAG: hypothetical protein RL196_572 [Actinomycetota bacterium]|jgi:hypothetical protein